MSQATSDVDGSPASGEGDESRDANVWEVLGMNMLVLVLFLLLVDYPVIGWDSFSPEMVGWIEIGLMGSYLLLVGIPVFSVIAYTNDVGDISKKDLAGYFSLSFVLLVIGNLFTPFSVLQLF